MQAGPACTTGVECDCRRRHSSHLRLQRQELAHQHSKQAQEYCIAVLDSSMALGSIAEDLHKRLHRAAFSESLAVTSHDGLTVGDDEAHCATVLT